MGSSNPRLSVPRDPPVWCEAETGSAVNITPELPAEQEETLSKHGRRRAVINPHPRMVGRSGRLGAATRVVPQRFVFRLCLLVRQRRFLYRECGVRADAVIGPMAGNDTRPTAGERVPLPRRASAGPRERPAAGDAKAMRKQGVTTERPVRAAEEFSYGRHSRRGKDSKTLVLAAIFGYFLPLLAESIPPETTQGVQCE